MGSHRSRIASRRPLRSASARPGTRHWHTSGCTVPVRARAAGRHSRMGQTFAHLAHRVATLTGHSPTFLAALVCIAASAVTGPLFDSSVTWPLVINTGTTIVTFLMVFLIQNTQTRDALAMQLKLDELIRATETADNAIIRAEDDTDE